MYRRLESIHLAGEIVTVCVVVRIIFRRPVDVRTRPLKTCNGMEIDEQTPTDDVCAFANHTDRAAIVI